MNLTWDEESARQMAGVLLDELGTVVELRALGVGTRGGVCSGYFDNADRLVEIASRLNGLAGVYVTLNPVHPDFLQRAPNRLETRPRSTTRDTEILARWLLLIDLDPERPTGVSATDAEKAKAEAVANQVREFLDGLGFPEPLRADSGNGAHLVYRINLPVDDEGLVRRFLQALAFRFDSEAVRIDQTVHNAARIVRFWGTVNCKGENTPERPHRRSRLMKIPAQLEEVPREVLEKLAARGVPQPPKRRPVTDCGSLDIDGYIARHGIGIARTSAWQSGRRWVLDVCLRFESDAQDLFNSWRADLERTVRSGDEHPAIESHLAKYRSLIPSLALLTHLADGGVGPVGVSSLQRAISWAKYLESHARRVYSFGISPDAVVGRRLSRKILDGTLKDGFSLRDVYRPCWAGLASRDEAERAVQVLEDLDWLRQESLGAGNARKTIYRINPAVYEAEGKRTDRSQASPTGFIAAETEPGENSETRGGGTDKADKTSLDAAVSVVSAAAEHSDGHRPSPEKSETGGRGTDRADTSTAHGPLSVMSVVDEGVSETLTSDEGPSADGANEAEWGVL